MKYSTGALGGTDLDGKPQLLAQSAGQSRSAPGGAQQTQFAQSENEFWRRMVLRTLQGCIRHLGRACFEVRAGNFRLCIFYILLKPEKAEHDVTCLESQLSGG